MKAPQVSVVMSVYNGAEYLEATLESILSQEGCEFEFIVVNDGSIDASVRILDHWSVRDSRLRLIHQENTGLTKALIRGCTQARGQFIARQDVGDLSLPGRLAKQREILLCHPQAAMATCGYRFVGPQGEHLGDVLPKHEPMDWTSILLEGEETLLYGPHHGTVMFRKSAYLAANGYREEFYYAQDLDIWTRMARFGGIEYTRETLYQVTFVHSSISARFAEQQRQLRRIIATATQRRQRSESEDDLLKSAAVIRGCRESGIFSPVPADYFIGSCLFALGNPKARYYFWRVLRCKPFMLKTWGKLLYSFLPVFKMVNGRAKFHQ